MRGTIWARWHDGTQPGPRAGWLLWQVVTDHANGYLTVRPLWSDQTERIHRHCLTGELFDGHLMDGRQAAGRE